MQSSLEYAYPGLVTQADPRQGFTFRRFNGNQSRGKRHFPLPDVRGTLQRDDLSGMQVAFEEIPRGEDRTIGNGSGLNGRILRMLTGKFNGPGTPAPFIRAGWV